jgi:hypothetical protein
MDVIRDLESWKTTPPLTLDQQAVGIAEGFAKVVAKAIAVSPAGRYQSMGELEKTVFISWRMDECKAQVRVLQPALEALGINVIVVSELHGGDLLQAVKSGHHHGH